MLRVGPSKAPVHLNGFSFRSRRHQSLLKSPTPVSYFPLNRRPIGRLTCSVVKSYVTPQSYFVSLLLRVGTLI